MPTRPARARENYPEGETVHYMELQVGSILEGKVTSITKFGAFVALDNGKSGLVHISEIANTFVNDVHDYLQEGQAVKVLVLSTENGKVNLSIKRTLPKPERPARGPRPASSTPPRHAAPCSRYCRSNSNNSIKSSPRFPAVPPG